MTHELVGAVGVGREETSRPWGNARVIDEGATFRVERLEIEQHRWLSYEVHDHWAEHWVVLLGTACCTIGRESFMAAPGDHLDIPRGVAHRVGNVGGTRLVVLVVERGDRL